MVSARHFIRSTKIALAVIVCESFGLSLTCDLGFDLALHLQRVHKDAAVADEARAGDSSVRLAEALFIKIVTGTTESAKRFKDISARKGQRVFTDEQYTQSPLEGSVESGLILCFWG